MTVTEASQNQDITVDQRDPMNADESNRDSAESEQFRAKLNHTLGTAFFLLAGMMSVAIFVDRWTTLNLRMPRAWYVSRAFHLPLTASLCFLGWKISALGKPKRHHQPVFDTVVVYTRRDCELCDEAIEVLQQHGDFLPTVSEVEIDENPTLIDAHGNWVPVVEIDGRIRFRGKVCPVLLSRMINTARRQATLSREEE